MWLVRGRLVCYLPASMAQICVRPPEPRAGVQRPGDCGGTPCTTLFTHRSLPNVSLLSAAQLALDKHSSHSDLRRTSLYCRRHNLRSMNTVHTAITAERLSNVGGTTCARTPQFTHQSPSNDSLLSAAQLALVQRCSHIDLRRMSLYCRRHNLRSMNAVHTLIPAERPSTVGGATCARTPFMQ